MTACPRQGCDGASHRGAVNIIACPQVNLRDGFVLGPGLVAMSDVSHVCPFLVEAGIVTKLPASEVPPEWRSPPADDDRFEARLVRYGNIVWSDDGRVAAHIVTEE